MTITAFSAFSGNLGPLTRVSPFTHRDNATFQRILQELIRFINTTLRDEMNSELESLLARFQEAADAYAADNTATKEGWQTLFDAFMIDVNENLKAMSDTQMTALLNDGASAFRTTFDVMLNGTITTTAQNVAAAYVGSQPAVVDAAAAAVNANPAIATLTGKVAWKTILADNTDIDTLRTPGVYTIATSTAAATMLNLPAPYSGEIFVSKSDTGVVTTQRFTGSGTNGYPEKYTRITRSTTTWTPWVNDRAIQGFIPSATDLNTFRTPGEYVITPALAATLTGLPAGIGTAWDGVLDVVATNSLQSATRTHRLRILSAGALVVFERVIALSTTTASSWVNMTPAAVLASGRDSGPYSHLDHFARACMRRGAIGTGKAAVAFRFDHHLIPFRDKVLPLLVKYSLPWAQVVNPDRVNTYSTDLMPWSEFNALVLENGGEVWNHGADHGDAVSEAALLTQIRTAKQSLVANCPEVAIEGWAPPGLAAGGYMGASPFNSVALNTETFAGQTIMGNHAFVAGYADGLYRALDGIAPIGAPHYTLDAAIPATVATHLDNIVERDAGIVLMVHPNLIDSVGQITLTQLETIFADVAARRDAGTLEVISYSGMWIANSGTTRREDMAPKAARVINTAVSAGGSHSTVLNVYNRVHQLGATKEIFLKFTAASVGTLNIAATGKPTTAHAVKVGTNIIRRPVTIGLSSGNVTITATPSVAITVTEFHAYSI